MADSEGDGGELRPRGRGGNGSSRKRKAAARTAAAIKMKRTLRTVVISFQSSVDSAETEN